MKKYIFMMLCLVFSASISAQDSVFVVHKKDGSRQIIDRKLYKQMTFVGKAIVNDDDYVRFGADAVVNAPLLRTDMSSVTLKVVDGMFRFVSSSIYYKEEGVGICYSTSPGVTVDNGTIIEYDSYKHLRFETDENGKTTEYAEFKIDDIDFDTEYYYRAYTYVEGKVYYSSEHSFNLGKPSMSWVVNDSCVNSGTHSKGFVYPTDMAWDKFCAHYPYFSGTDTEQRNRILQEAWRESCLSKVEDNVEYDSVVVCSDGTVFYTNEIPDSFMDILVFDETKIDGWDYDSLRMCDMYKVECGEEYGVPGNIYAEYVGKTSSSLPDVYYTLPQPLLANYKYHLEVVMAPETKDDVTKKPNKFRIGCGTVVGSSFHSLSDEEGTYTFVSDPLECKTIALDFVLSNFGDNRVMLRSYVSSKETKDFTRALRVACIRIKPVEPVDVPEDVQE